MSNAVNLLVTFAETVGQDVHDLKTIAQQLEAKQGDLSTLTTTQKNTLVGAVNELKSALTNVSSTMVTQPQMTTAINDALNSIIDGAPQAWNTFKEFADYVAADQTAAAAMLDALAKRVRVDAAQNFTATEQAMGRTNIGAASAADLGDVANFDPTAKYVAKRDAA